MAADPTFADNQEPEQGPFIGDLRRIQTEALAISRSLRMATAPGMTYAGADDNGTVHVVLNAHGATEAVRLDPAWQRWLADDELGAAIFHAYRSALRTLILAQHDRLTGQSAADAATPDLADALPENRTGSMLFADIARRGNYTTELDRIRNGLDDARRQGARFSPPDEPRTATSRRGAVTVTTTGTEVTAVRVDLLSPALRSAAELGREALSAFQRAAAGRDPAGGR